MIWPSGGAASTLQLICNQLPSCGRLASSAEIPYCELTSFGAEFLQSGACAADGAQPPAVGTTAQPYTAGRPTPPRLAVFQRFCSGRARGEPSAMLPAARARQQWFMTKEEGVRLRSSLF